MPALQADDPLSTHVAPTDHGQASGDLCGRGPVPRDVFTASSFLTTTPGADTTITSVFSREKGGTERLSIVQGHTARKRRVWNWNFGPWLLASCALTQDAVPRAQNILSEPSFLHFLRRKKRSRCSAGPPGDGREGAAGPADGEASFQFLPPPPAPGRCSGQSPGTEAGLVRASPAHQGALSSTAPDEATGRLRGAEHSKKAFGMPRPHPRGPSFSQNPRLPSGRMTVRPRRQVPARTPLSLGSRLPAASRALRSFPNTRGLAPWGPLVD